MMRYWWVNQNKTYAQEREGGYLWSPKRKTNGARNPFYDFMRISNITATRSSWEKI